MAKDNTLAVITHLLGLISGFIGPLIVLFITADEQAKAHSKQALN